MSRRPRLLSGASTPFSTPRSLMKERLLRWMRRDRSSCKLAQPSTTRRGTRCCVERKSSSNYPRLSVHQDALRVSTAVDTGSCGHGSIVSIVTGDFLHGVLSFHLWYLLVSNPKNRTVAAVPSFLTLLAESHVEARPLPADRFTLLEVDASKIPSVRISCSFIGANDL